jgi:hypothetical protein
VSRCLIVFIDGLPHYELARTTTLRAFPATCALQPPFGYSPNIYAELYAGLTADEVGFFNEWTRDAEAGRDRVNLVLRALSPLLDRTRASGLTSTLAHRLVGRLVRRSLANIPFRDLRWYAHRAVKVYDTARFRHETLFGRHGFTVVTGEQFRGIGARDERVFADGLAAVRGGGNVYLSFVDYDNLCHRHGVASRVVRDRLQLLDQYVQLLDDTFRSRHPDGAVFVVSDHGMVDVTAGHDLRIEDAFGPPHPDRYLYFPDSVMCRVWCPDEARRASIGAWFAGLGVGHVVREDERERWGVTDRAFGDLMFVLDPPRCFQQNFHGWRLPRAMHGYHPDHYSQWGIFLARNAPEVVTGTVVSPREVHALLERRLAA